MIDDIVEEFIKLYSLVGGDFIRQLIHLTLRKEFHPVMNETNIYATGNLGNDDSFALLRAARKAVFHGYKVYILPNPKGIRTADFIFVQHGIYKMYDLKTIQGKASVYNRLMESVGQTNHVLLNMETDYNATALARSIRKYFERNVNAKEVLIFRGSKVLPVTRRSVEDKTFIKTFVRIYNK